MKVRLIEPGLLQFSDPPFALLVSERQGYLVIKFLDNNRQVGPERLKRKWNFRDQDPLIKEVTRYLYPKGDHALKKFAALIGGAGKYIKKIGVRLPEPPDELRLAIDRLAEEVAELDSLTKEILKKVEVENT